jgi:hypothetical protein
MNSTNSVDNKARPGSGFGFGTDSTETVLKERANYNVIVLRSTSRLSEKCVS